MKTFKQFQESVASLALKGAVKFLPKIPSALKAVTAGALTGLTVLQANRGRPERGEAKRYNKNPNKKRKLSRMAQKQIEIENKRGEQVTNVDPLKGMIKSKPGEVRKTEKLIDKYKETNKVIKPIEGEIKKQRELLKNKEKEITQVKPNEKKEASKTVKDFLKARKKEGETMYKLKRDAEIADKGPGDLLPDAKKTYLNKLLSNLKNKKTTNE
tara:strand:- start:218 stop:856 length:639 start_codon:yes stop_codon:yes gene_type:complete